MSYDLDLFDFINRNFIHLSKNIEERRTHLFNINEFDDTQLRYLLDCIKGTVFTLSLYYVVSDFNNFFRDYLNEFCDVLFSEFVNKALT